MTCSYSRVVKSWRSSKFSRSRDRLRNDNTNSHWFWCRRKRSWFERTSFWVDFQFSKSNISWVARVLIALASETRRWELISLICLNIFSRCSTNHLLFSKSFSTRIQSELIDSSIERKDDTNNNDLKSMSSYELNKSIAKMTRQMTKRTRYRKKIWCCSIRIVSTYFIAFWSTRLKSLSSASSWFTNRSSIFKSSSSTCSRRFSWLTSSSIFTTFCTFFDERNSLFSTNKFLFLVFIKSSSKISLTSRCQRTTWSLIVDFSIHQSFDTMLRRSRLTSKWISKLSTSFFFSFFVFFILDARSLMWSKTSMNFSFASMSRFLTSNERRWSCKWEDWKLRSTRAFTLNAFSMLTREWTRSRVSNDETWRSIVDYVMSSWILILTNSTNDRRRSKTWTRDTKSITITMSIITSSSHVSLSIFSITSIESSWLNTWAFTRSSCNSCSI